MMEDAPTQNTPPNVSTPSQGDPELEESPETTIVEKELEKKRRKKKNLYRQSTKDLKEDFSLRSNHRNKESYNWRWLC